MNPCQIIDTRLMDDVIEQARAVPRRRKNHNFHTHLEAPCNRLLNAMEPDSYVQPHCHAHPDKDETMLILRGSMGLLFFDAAGKPTDGVVLAAGSDRVGVTIPRGVFHSVLALETGTLFFEAKAGPYLPLTAGERGAWAPAEGMEGTQAYLAQMRAWLAGFAGAAL